MLLYGLLMGCIADSAAYGKRLDELTDHDGDSYAQEDDCDDADPAVFPGAVEVCDGVDQDCDTDVDEGAVDAPAWYPDADVDGYGDSGARPVTACEAPTGWVANDLDCADDDATRNPAGEERPYDGVDDDCDGADQTDVDGDGYDSTVVGGDDCDDGSTSVHPGADDVPYDGIDQDCSGTDEDDLDHDGSPADEASGSDCDDGDDTVFPGADETWADGLTDNDCDGEIETVRLDFGASAWKGAVPDGQAGRRVGALGDVDGDGLAEYLVGAPYDSTAFADGGAAYLVPGGKSDGMLSETPALLAGGGDWNFPQVVAGGPDIDGDGWPDIVATALGEDSFRGVAFLVSGGALAAGTLTLPADSMMRIDGSVAGDLAGTGASFVGDVIGDGGSYLAVSALNASTSSGVGSGVVAVFALDALSDRSFGDAVLSTDGPYDGALLGNVVSGAGDLDADGIEDLFVSCGYGDVAYVVPGGVANASLPGDALFRLTGTVSTPVADCEMLGDVDGDGEKDLACLVENVEARVFTSLLSEPVREVDAPASVIALGEGALGYDLLDLGDLDGDGRDDSLVPAQWYPDLATSFLGIVFGESLTYRAEVGLEDAVLSAASVRPSGKFGYRVARSGDVDGDGGDDIIVGGYADTEGGVDAGAVLTIPIPH